MWQAPFLCLVQRSKPLPSGVLFKIAVGFVFHFNSVCNTSLSPEQQVPLFAWKAILISSITVFWRTVQCVCIMLDIGFSVLFIHSLFAHCCPRYILFFFLKTSGGEEKVELSYGGNKQHILKTCSQFGVHMLQTQRTLKGRGYARHGNACSELQ